MKTPMSKKSEEMKGTIENLFPGTRDAIATLHCPICRDKIGHFKDQLSRREYEVSGLCQSCQSSIFSGEEDSD